MDALPDAPTAHITGLVEEPTVPPTMAHAVKAWLKYRQEEWALTDEMVTLVPRFFALFKPNRDISCDMVIDLLREPCRPEILPVVLGAICYRMRPLPTSLNATLQGMEALSSRESRLLLFSMTLLKPRPSFQASPKSSSPTASYSSSINFPQLL